MLSIAIYDDNKTYLNELREMIQEYLIESKSVAKVSIFDKSEDLLVVPASFDVYIMDTDSSENLYELSRRMDKIDPNSYFIFIGEDPSLAYPAYKVHADHYFLKPIEKEELFELFNIIKKKIREDSLVIKTAEGERRIRSSQVNYINIVKRCLCYHLKNGTMFDGQSLRSSFEKAITPLNQHPQFLFLAPSLLINLSEIKIIDTDHLTFENDEVLYFPKKSHDLIRERWLTYNKI